MTNRIEKLFEEKRRKGEKSLVFFITAGFPDREQNEDIIYTLAESGCDILELGVPFSDPIADGPTIQRSSERALRQGVTLGKILESVKSLRERTEIPIVLFSSFNPLLKFGLNTLIPQARKAGIDGILCPDLPPEEGGELSALCRDNGLSLIFLIAPTTLPERKKFIAEQSSGFIYYVSLKGVTGAREQMSSDLSQQVKEIKSFTSLPVVVGFGISRPEHTHIVAQSGADGAVVGSALINLIEKYETSDELLQKVKEFVKALKNGLKSSG
ncbi:tryptophan synthase subunit alpha [Candidatus Sumerlaeota bacterium]|nr:tryptophan synthase subunit alpha [Candidatus Sumerlaeota bacterium]